MAGSSTQSVENFTPQGMVVNAEMMKHLKITNRASVREIMLQHEKTFKEQVHDLHKLYGVQRLLMDKAKSGGRDAYTGGLPPSPFCGYAVPEESNHGQGTNFWAHASADGMGAVVKGGGTSTHLGSAPMAVLEGTSKVEEAPKNVVSSPVRKRKIDLEQLPEDDSDDEMENSVNIPNPTTSCLSRNLEELPKLYSGFDAPVKQGPRSQPVQLLPPTINPSFVSRDGSMSGGDIHVKVSPIFSLNVSKTEENLSCFGERNTSFQNAGMLISGVATQKNNSMFLPQADLIDRASQETAHWFLQASEPKIVDTSVRLPAQQQRLSPHLALPDQSTSRGNPSTPQLDQLHHNNIPPRIESVGSSMSKISLERHSPGGHAGAPKDTSSASAERLGSSSKWFSKESTLQALPANVVPVARVETGVMPEGGHGLPGTIAPPSNKGFGQERESLWASKNPVLQAPQFQQPPIFQQQIAPPAGQSLWVPSSQNAQNSIYSQQQVMYGYHHSSEPGYRGESLQQRNPGDIAGPWNMIGLGHFYSGIPSTPQKPPFKKPPKLVLKNDGVGMELKLVSPEKEMSEKDRALQKKPLSVLKRDALQASSKSRDNSSGVQKQAGEEDTKLGKRITEIPNFTGEAKGLLKTASVPIEPTLLATDSSSSTLTLSPGASTCVTLPCAAPLNLGALACSSGSETGSGFYVSTLTNKSIPQQCVPQTEMLPESKKIAEQRVWNVKTSKISSGEESLPLNNAGSRDIHGQMEGSSLLKGEIIGNAGFGIVEEKKNSLDKMETSQGNAIDGAASSQSVSFNTTPQVVKSKCVEKAVVPQRAQKLDDNKGGLSQGCANVESYQKEVPESKAPCNGGLTYPADQFAMQAISVQSTSTDTPSNSRQEKKRFSIFSEKNMLQRASGRISNACKNESRSPQSDRDCVSAPSSSTLMLEAKVETLVGDSNDDLQHDSESDNLAATILLSFAPKMGLLNEEKQSKDSTSEISSSICKVKSAEQGSKRSRPSEARTGSRSASSQMQKMQNPKRVDPRDQHGRSKLTIKDRHRREEMNHADRPIGEGDVVVKSLTVKLPRVASSTSHEGAIPLSRSKELSKLNGASLSGHPVESSKIIHRGNDAVHTPTGRRSSRGPPMASRVPVESRSRLQQQTQLSSPQSSPQPADKDHGRVESSPQPADKDSVIREKEGARSITKLEGNMKSKAWGELNRTRSHLRRHFPETSNRKSQK